MPIPPGTDLAPQSTDCFGGCMGRKKKSGQGVELNLASKEVPEEETSSEDSSAELDAISANEDAVTEDESATSSLPLPEIEEAEAVPKPRARRPARSKQIPDTVAAFAEDSSAAAIKHWEVVRSITESITRHLEKISHQLQEISLHAPQAPAVVERYLSPKVTLLNRVTLAVSGASLVLGLVGLSMSQSVREEFLNGKAVMQPSSAQAAVSESSFAKESVPPAVSAIDAITKKPSDLTRRQKELWRLRRGN